MQSLWTKTKSYLPYIGAVDRGFRIHWIDASYGVEETARLGGEDLVCVGKHPGELVSAESTA